MLGCRISKLSVLALLAGVGTHVCASETVQISQFGEEISFQLPDGFSSGFSQKSDDALLIEYPNSGATLDNWSEMVTISLHHMGGRIDTVAIASFMSQSASEQCTREVVAGFVQPQVTVGEIIFDTLYVSCGRKKGASESEAYVAHIASTPESIVTIQRALKGKSKLNSQAFDDEWFLRTISVWPIVINGEYLMDLN